MGTRGQLRGDQVNIRHLNFLNNREDTHNAKDIVQVDAGTGHGGDATVILNFVAAIAKNDPSLLLTSPEASLESHLMAFAAERSRKNRTVEEIRLD